MRSEIENRSDLSIVLVFFGALAVMGLFAGGFVVQDYARARASASWPTANGVILSRLEGAGAGLRYAYSMDGRSYESGRERVFLARFLAKPSPDRNPGDTVTVFVSPKDHGYALLYPGGAGVAFVIFSIVSGGCVFFGIGGIVWALSQTAGRHFLSAAEAA
ncbi:MAG: DUF3592 domain-containing protein [Hyphococcus sp.]